ncbi:hypothetical protein AB0904_30505 [Streptomyces sp. NPDC006684]|uniref:hypothetical protein n=1 Tax=Streptomyces sp. NPDC006684 TaxID=3154477 RepID=UPI0034548977
MVVTAATDCSAPEVVADLRAPPRDPYRRRGARHGGRSAGELPAGPDTPALAPYVAAVLQGLPPQARDGATAAEPVAALALAVRPGA